MWHYDIVQFLNMHWTASLESEAVIMLRVRHPKEAYKGRVLAVTPSGIWECSRDGKDTFLEKFDTNPAVFRDMRAGFDRINR